MSDATATTHHNEATKPWFSLELEIRSTFPDADQVMLITAEGEVWIAANGQDTLRDWRTCSADIAAKEAWCYLPRGHGFEMTRSKLDKRPILKLTPRRHDD